MRKLLLPPLLLVVALTGACSGDDGDDVNTAPSATPSASESASETGTPSASTTPTDDASSSASASTSASASAAAGSGTPVTASANAAQSSPELLPLTAKPARGSDATLQIGYSLEAQTIKIAEFVAKTSSTCSPKVVLGTTKATTCTVTYAGLKVPYSVTIEGGTTFPITSSTTKVGVLSRQAVADELFRTSGKATGGITDARCDVPEFTLVTLQEKTPYTCTFSFASSPERVQTQEITLMRTGPNLRTRF